MKGSTADWKSMILTVSVVFISAVLLLSLHTFSFCVHY